MCGRYSFKAKLKPEAVVFPDETKPPLVPRFNIAPTQYAAIRPLFDANKYHFYRWGLIPAWSRDTKGGASMINARAETLAEKPAFRDLLATNRCLVPASGYFEWKISGKSRQPYYIHCPAQETILFAGLFTQWKAPDGAHVHSFTVVTTTPTRSLAAIHDRMPVILSEENANAWLDPNLQPADLPGFWMPDSGLEIEAYPVSDRVGKVQNDDAGLLDPVKAFPEQGSLF